VALPTAGNELHWQRMSCVADGCLRLDMTLFCGQAFRWVDNGTVSWRGSHWREYSGALHRSLLVLRQAADEPPPSAPEVGVDIIDPVFYAVAAGEGADGATEEMDAIDSMLRDYLRADVDMRPIAVDLCERDARYAHVFPYFRGGRHLRQDPTECLFAFICSSNNNVKRITSMVTHLAAAYGDPLGEYKGTAFFSFPTVARLVSRADEADLRAAGFGYRARYIIASAAQLLDLGGEDYLLSLRERPRQEVATELLALMGIGRKVAGCISLMSMDCEDEIPVDTHVWTIATRDYIPSLRAKTLTDRIYTQVGDMFRNAHGPYAGWANQTLFCAELGPFKHRLSTSLAPAVVTKQVKLKGGKVSMKTETAIAKTGAGKLARSIPTSGDIRTGLRSRKRLTISLSTPIPASTEIDRIVIDDRKDQRK
jgi:N-glycosylase/DNA lyase